MNGHLKVKIIVYCLAILGSISASPALADPKPDELLKMVLASDFQGSGDGRMDKVEYTVRPPPDHGILRDDVFLFDIDPFKVVQSFEISKNISTISSSELHIDVQFLVCAQTAGIGNPTLHGPHSQGIVPLRSPQKVTLNYSMIERDGTWKILNPPAPMVGRLAAISRVSELLINQLDPQKFFALLRFDKDRLDIQRWINNHHITRVWLEKQLTVLQSLSCGS